MTSQTPSVLRTQSWAVIGALALLLVFCRPAAASAATADAGSDETTALGRPVTLDGSGSTAGPGATYAWSFGDGESTSSANPSATHNYRFANSYTATLTVTDSGGASTDTATVSIEMSATNIDYSLLPTDRTDYLTETPSTRYVSLTGSDSSPGTKSAPYRTIQYALAQAAPSSTVFIRAGHYFTGDIEIAKSGIALAAYPSEKVVIEADRYDVWEHRNGIMLSGALANVVVDGIEIRHFKTQGLRFGDENTQRGIIFKNVVVYDAEEGISTLYSGNTPAKAFIDGFLVRNATLQHVRGIGFNAGQGAEIPLYRNVRLDGVHVSMAKTGNNTASDAIAFEGGQNVLAENSLAQGASGDGFDFKADRSAVVNSIARRITRNGFKLWSNGEIVNSLVYDTGADAGVVMESGEFRIVNSALAWHLKGQQGGAYSMTAGYDASNFDSLEVFRSIFFEECDRFYVTNSGPGSLTVNDNVFWRFGMNRILQYGNVDYETVSEINAQSWGDGNVARDPGFTNPAGDDWRIASGSNGFVFPDLKPAPVVTVTSPAYRYPVGPNLPIRFSSDQAGTYRVEATTNAVRAGGTLVRTGAAAKNTSYSVPVPYSVPAGRRAYVFVTSPAGSTGWEWRPIDTYRPRTFAPNYAIVTRNTYGYLRYQVIDPYSSKADVTIGVRNSGGGWVKKYKLGWVPTGQLRPYRFLANLPPGRYTFLVYATDFAKNTQTSVARNVLVVK